MPVLEQGALGLTLRKEQAGHCFKKTATSMEQIKKGSNKLLWDSIIA